MRATRPAAFSAAALDRVANVMAARPTVEQVVRTACAFGQEDDITAVSVTRIAASEPLPAVSLRPVASGG